jgi:hypothetical protein
MDNQLPAEVLAKIKKDAIDKSYEKVKGSFESKFGSCFRIGYETGHAECATEYATKLHQAEQEIVQLKQWKKAQLALLSPILDYGESKEAGIPLGKSITSTVLERCKGFATLRAKCDRYEAALKDIAKQWNVKELKANGYDGDIPEGYDAIINVARKALSGDGGRICPNCNKVFNADRHGCCRECGSDEYNNQKEDQ